VLCGLVGCSEYNLKASNSSSVPDDTGFSGQEPACAMPNPPVYEVSRDETCRVEPEVGTFEPVVEWAWHANPVHPGVHQVCSTPVVGHLTDDNGDGSLGEGDTPDVITLAFYDDEYMATGSLVGLSGRDGSTLFSWASVDGCLPYSSSGLALADLDGDGEPSILLQTSCGLTSVDRFGTVEWATPIPDSDIWLEFWTPSLADLDGDGGAEVMVGRSVFDTDGTLLWRGDRSHGNGTSFAADLDQDGVMEVIAGGTVYEADGRVRWDAGEDGFSGIADLDLDGEPEIVLVDVLGNVHAYSRAGVELWVTEFPVDKHGGPPTLADYNGDGLPEIGVAFATAYRVLDGDGVVLWSQVTEDDSSGVTGSAVFDFEGDGAAEVVYADEHVFYIYDGATGAIEMAYEHHASGTVFEYPVIVDLDGDDSAEIVLVSNNFWWEGHAGITVIGDLASSWAPARELWSQHAYHITHIEDDGTVPRVQEASWLTHNTFRAANTETPAGLMRPDLHLGEPEICTLECELGRTVIYLPVENSGLADTEEVGVALYSVDEGGETTLVEHWSVPLVRFGEAQWLGPLHIDTEAFSSQGIVLRVDDDGSGIGKHEECDESNNDYSLFVDPCAT